MSGQGQDPMGGESVTFYLEGRIRMESQAFQHRKAGKWGWEGT